MSDDRARMLERWVTTFQPVVFRTAYLVLKDAAAAERVARETFERAARALRYGRPGDGARIWLLQIAFDAMRSREKKADPARLALICRYFLELSPRETARVLRIRAGAVDVSPGDETDVRIALDAEAHEIDVPKGLRKSTLGSPQGVASLSRREVVQARVDAVRMRLPFSAYPRWVGVLVGMGALLPPLVAALLVRAAVRVFVRRNHG